MESKGVGKIDVGPTDDSLSRILQEDPGDASSTAGHKRSLSGSILSKLSFLRYSGDNRDVVISKIYTDCSYDNIDGPRKPADAVSPTSEERKTRKRKGSLRKTAILGTGRLRLEGREKKNSALETVKSAWIEPNKGVNTAIATIDTQNPDSADESPTPRQSYEKPSSTHSVKPSSPTQVLGQRHSNDSDDSLPLTILSRKSTLADMSTTDEDDALTFSHTSSLTSSLTSILPPLKKPSAGGSSYFPLESASSLSRRRSSNNPKSKPKSPLASLPLEPLPAPEEWDYSETEWWGWVILVLTWIVVVVGMGSCFGVWSWAWDVGETPYAPPELEDDPTLPIVGYYPALIILTSVMAWVWVVVAWVGMKYFRHAKISGEDL